MKIKVTPESVRAAYIEKNLKPIRGEFGVRYGGGEPVFTPYRSGRTCAIGALMAGLPSDGRPIFTQAADALDLPSTRCFAWGFDDAGITDQNVAEEPDARACYELGKTCWEAVKDLAEEERP